MAVSLFRGGRRDGASAFEEGRLGFAVGDIHGRADLLERMLDRIEREIPAPGARKPTVIFLGDYVDRGAGSAEVIARLLEWRPPSFDLHFLKGNHEASMLAFLEAPVVNRNWLQHGGLETMASYGLHPLPSMTANDELVFAAAQRFRELVPEAHLDFLRNLERFVVFGDYAFVHAGIDFGRPIEDQQDHDLLWARDRFLADKRKYSHVIVHGHTPVDAPYFDERRICVDLGAYATGRLCAARFDGEAVTFMIVRIGRL